MQTGSLSTPNSLDSKALARSSPFMRTRITNGATETINGLLQLAKKRARGYQSIRSFRIMAYLMAGKLKLDVQQFKSLLTH